MFRQVNNTVDGFPLCANDIIVSVNDTPMTKYEAIWNEDFKMFADVFKGWGTKPRKVVILRYTTK